MGACGSSIPAEACPAAVKASARKGTSGSSSSISTHCPSGARVGFCTLRGVKQGPPQPNQDTFCLHELPGRYTVVGVFDGHGEKGHVVSGFAKKSCSLDVMKYGRCPTGDLPEVLRSGFGRVQRHLETRTHLGGKMSGTTATVMAFDHQQDRVTVSHVGDSSAVLLRRRSGAAGEEVEAIPLTRDHDPELPDEKRRIIRAGGRVVDVGGFNRVIKAGTRGPGLNMSRSLGDIMAHSCGVSAEPEVSSVQLCPRDLAILVCSDGIWTVLSPQEAADIIKDFPPSEAMAAAERLAETARALWLQGTGGTKADDITVTVVYPEEMSDCASMARAPSTASLSSGHSSVSSE